MSSPEIDENLPLDPASAKYKKGWGVVKRDPWHLKGVYATKEKAQKALEEVPNDYLLRFGSYRIGGVDDFVWSSSDQDE